MTRWSLAINIELEAASEGDAVAIGRRLADRLREADISVFRAELDVYVVEEAVRRAYDDTAA